jgi:hypothetical protein
MRILYLMYPPEEKKDSSQKKLERRSGTAGVLRLELPSMQNKIS